MSAPSKLEQIELGLSETEALVLKKVVPYDYQSEAVVAFKEWFHSQEPESLIALATGMGKTFTACLGCQYILGLGQKILWVTHRNELLEQSATALGDLLGVVVGVEKAEHRAKYTDQVIIASIQTLKGARFRKFSENFTPDLIVFDEAHHSVARTWMHLKMVYSQAKVLNLTATPYRGDISSRLELGKVLIERNTSDGIKQGFLVPPKPVGSIKLQLKGIKMSMGDYEVESLTELMLTKSVLDGCTKAVLDNLKGRRCIVFAASVEHGQELAKVFVEKGIKHVYEVYAETPIPLRRAYYKAVRENTDCLLINNACLIEGFDLPALDFVAIFRPTKNAALFLQMLGRGLRTCKDSGKVDCLVIDAVDVQKHSTGTSKLILPSEGDQRKASAMVGKQVTLLKLFLSWFYRQEEVELSIKGEFKADKRKLLSTSQMIFDELLPELIGKWFPAQIKNIATLQDILDSDTDYKGPFDQLAKLTGTRHIEAFVKVMQDNDWRYFPHNELPKTEEEDLGKKEETEDLVDEGDEFTANAASLNAIAELDPNLKFFLLNVLGEKNLTKQATSYYSSFPVGEAKVAWFKTINIPTSGFHFIQEWDAKTKINHFWIRFDDTGDILKLKVEGKSILYEPGEVSAATIPTFAKGTGWSSQPMSEGQYKHVKNILGMQDADLKALNISKLSASALMSNNFADRTLERIVRNIPSLKSFSAKKQAYKF